MTVTKKAIQRRTFLRGMGVAMALPFLDAMIPAFATAQTAFKPVRRLGYVYFPMGMNAALWTPKDEGRITDLSPSLASLAPLIDHINVLTNLELRNAYTTGNHATANAAFLSCARAKRTEGGDLQLGITVDQIAAKELGKDTPIPSLELGTDVIAQVGNCDNGYACAYQNNLSWSSATTPLPTEADPRTLFERLFGDGGSADDRRRDLKTKGSILDWLTEDMARLQRELGRNDRTKLDQYVESVREVERRIQKAEQRTGESLRMDLERPTTLPAEWEEHVKLMFDLQTLAYQADLTRVITFQLAREASTRTYPNIGVSEPHHPISHHVNDPEKLAKLAKINAYHVALFTYFLERLKAVPEGDGSLLDHSMILFGSGMGNPDVHDHSNLPIIVAGAGGGSLKGGRHIRYAQQTPMANLHLTLLDKAGIHLDSFVDSTGKVRELLEPLSIN
jgi:Protein of unknown function (DUF1552)